MYIKREWERAGLNKLIHRTDSFSWQLKGDCLRVDVRARIAPLYTLGAFPVTIAIPYIKMAILV